MVSSRVMKNLHLLSRVELASRGELPMRAMGLLQFRLRKFVTSHFLAALRRKPGTSVEQDVDIIHSITDRS